MKSVWFALIVCGWLIAQGGIAQSTLKPQVQGAVSYLTGGVGEDEQAALKAAQNEYPLGLTFTQGSRSEWLSDVRVVITAASSGAKVLDATSAGPVMLVKLRNGAYRVSVSSGGRSYDREVKLGGGREQLTFNFAAP